MIFKEGGSDINVYENPEAKAPGDEAEDEILEFLADAFGSIKSVTQTKKWGENDQHGIDGVLVLENDDSQEFLVALETSGPEDARKREKVKQQAREPMVRILEERDEQGNVVIPAINEKIPRLRLGYNIGYILALAHESKEKGMRMSHNLQQNHHGELVKMKHNILDSFKKQIEAQSDYEFRKAIKPVAEIFEEEEEELAA